MQPLDPVADIGPPWSPSPLQSVVAPADWSWLTRYPAARLWLAGKRMHFNQLKRCNAAHTAGYRSRVIRPICTCVGTAIFLFAMFGIATADTKRVMLLHSFGRDFKPWSEYAKSIRAQLDRQSPWPLDIFDHSLVTARSSDEDPEGPFVEYLRALFAKQPLDLIVSIGAPAAAFVQRHRQQLFTDTPMVLTAVEQRRVQYSSSYSQ